MGIMLLVNKWESCASETCTAESHKENVGIVHSNKCRCGNEKSLQVILAPKKCCKSDEMRVSLHEELKKSEHDANGYQGG